MVYAFFSGDMTAAQRAELLDSQSVDLVVVRSDRYAVSDLPGYERVWQNDGTVISPAERPVNSPQVRFAALVAALLVTAVFATQVGDPNTILRPPDSEYTDLLITHWPNAEFFKQSVLQDHCWPLWNPSIFSGNTIRCEPT